MSAGRPSGKEGQLRAGAEAAVHRWGFFLREAKLSSEGLSTDGAGPPQSSSHDCPYSKSTDDGLEPPLQNACTANVRLSARGWKPSQVSTAEDHRSLMGASLGELGSVPSLPLNIYITHAPQSSPF